MIADWRKSKILVILLGTANIAHKLSKYPEVQCSAPSVKKAGGKVSSLVLFVLRSISAPYRSVYLRLESASGRIPGHSFSPAG